MRLQNILKRMCISRKRGPYKGKAGNKRRKIDEANYFHICMQFNEKYPGTFQFNYSAFLSAARSVLQYTHEEVNPDCNPNAEPGALKWYRNAVAKSKVIKFGRDERDENIHSFPVIPNTHATVVVKQPMPIKEGGLAIVQREGRTIQTIPIQSEVVAGIPVVFEASYKYTSSRWTGPENLLEVCRLYLDKLEALVKEGVEKGYITW